MSHDHAYLMSEEEVTIETEQNKNVINIPQAVETKVEQQHTSIDASGGEENGNIAASSGQSDMVFGTYDEASNCITIFMPPSEGVETGTEGVEQQEQRTGSITSEEIKSMAVALEPCLSPLSSLSLMDSGYQSLGSPDSSVDLCWAEGAQNVDGALDELWNDSFSELFPSLV